MTYCPNDLDNGLSIQTTDSRNRLSLAVNDDRSLNTLIKIKNGAIDSTFDNDKKL